MTEDVTWTIGEVEIDCYDGWTVTRLERMCPLGGTLDPRRFVALIGKRPEGLSNFGVSLDMLNRVIGKPHLIIPRLSGQPSPDRGTLAWHYYATYPQIVALREYPVCGDASCCGEAYEFLVYRTLAQRKKALEQSTLDDIL